MRKTFNHKLLPVIDIEDKIIDGKRFYFLPDGRKFPSVTTVIGQKLPKGEGLINWRKRVGDKKADAVLKEASRRGTAVHDLAEKYVLNEEDYKGNHRMMDIASFGDLRRMLEEHVDNILGVEFPLYNVALNTAGRGDLFAQYDGVTSYIDYKTSLNDKKEEWIQNYFLQATTYAMMFEWVYKIAVPQIVVTISVDTGPIQIFKKDKAQYVDQVLEIFTK